MRLISQAYDSHCNLVLGEVEETIYRVDEDEDDDHDHDHDGGGQVRTVKKTSEMLFVRGRAWCSSMTFGFDDWADAVNCRRLCGFDIAAAMTTVEIQDDALVRALVAGIP